VPKTNQYSGNFAKICADLKAEPPSNAPPQNARISFEKFIDGSKFRFFKCAKDEVRMALLCLQRICQRTWDQINESGAKGGKSAGLNYEKVDDKELKGTSRPSELSDEIVIHSVRAMQRIRIFGYRIKDDFHPIWFDPKHEICEG
jgi:hypothetical protein